MNTTYRICSGGTLQGEFSVPGDKSISHRALMIASIADGNSRIDGLLEGEDVIRTMHALKAIGANIERIGEQTFNIVGKQTFTSPSEPLYLGNSGTAIRLLSGLFCALGITAELTGDKSLNSRPMQRMVGPLNQAGFSLQTTMGHPPIIINALPSPKSEPFFYQTPVASAQIKSGILLSRLFIKNTTTIQEPGPSRDHTELMLQGFSADIQRKDNTVKLQGGTRLKATNITIPGDISSAAFLIIGACIIPDSNIVIKNVGLNPTRVGALEILQQMGADIIIQNKRHQGKELTGDISVHYSPSLRGINIPENLIPLAIDEFPIIFVAAAFASGTTTIRGATELRHKESDRLSVMAQALKSMNIQVTEYEDGLSVTGGKLKPPNRPIDSCHDHRIAMTLSIAGMAMNQGEILIEGCDTVNTSFPNFAGLCRQLGMNIETI